MACKMIKNMKCACDTVIQACNTVGLFLPLTLSSTNSLRTSHIFFFFKC